MTAIVVLGPSALAMARRVAGVIGDAAIHGPAGLAGAETEYTAVAPHLRGLFAAGIPIIGVCAAGILVRALAPVLGDKAVEPPVLALAEDGGAVVPLLGGHHGANRLARALGGALGCHAAITTASDRRLGFALDAPPPGWRLAPGGRVKAVTAALLAGEPVALDAAAGQADWLRASDAPFAATGRLGIAVTERTGATADVVLHPAVLALGLGCERGADAAEVIALSERALDDAALSRDALACVASLDLKIDEPAILAAARHFGVPARFFDARRLERETPRLASPSDAVFRAVGCHGVAEAAALACAGSDGTLAVAKLRATRATCAIARASRPINPARVGRGRGHVTVLGLGPGAPEWRTPAVDAALGAATDLVGYGLYLDQIRARQPGQARHAFGLGDEAARADAALDLAAAGRRVALVSSGDAGIYGMASLLFERADAHAGSAAIDITVEPGISAVQAAAARAGAPIGHDFCAISLSDLLTPESVIIRRLEAAAHADFVVALYNPASRARRALLDRALSILRPARPPECPVVVARNLGRAGEAITIVPLGALDPAAVDMLTILIVGNGETRRTGQGAAFTPRGYGSAPARARIP